MIQRIVRVLRRTGLFYLEKQIPRSSAAMAYYLTMSLFPLIICLYALLGKSYHQMSRVLELADHVLQPTTFPLTQVGGSALPPAPTRMPVPITSPKQHLIPKMWIFLYD